MTIFIVMARVLCQIRTRQMLKLRLLYILPGEEYCSRNSSETRIFVFKEGAEDSDAIIFRENRLNSHAVRIPKKPYHRMRVIIARSVIRPSYISVHHRTPYKDK